jgi:hypothetical protein
MTERQQLRARGLELAIALLDAVPQDPLSSTTWIKGENGELLPIDPAILHGIADRMIEYIER